MRHTLGVLAILGLVLSVFWSYFDFGFEPVIAIVTSLGTLLALRLTAKHPSQEEAANTTGQTASHGTNLKQVSDGKDLIGASRNFPNSIPIPNGFVGRQAEMGDLFAKHATGQRVFVFAGMGGVGKSDLARTFAHAIGNQYQALIEVPMKGTGEPLSASEAMSEIFFAFDPTSSIPQSETAVRNRFLSLMAQYRTIVLLDDVKDLNQIAPMLGGNCCLVVTSRQRLILEGELIDVPPLSPDEAVRLLSSSRELIGEHASEIAKLCGYLPLALKLIRDLLLRRRLLDVGTFIESFGKARLEHLDEVTTSLSLSYEELDPDARRLWRTLAVFPGRFEAGGAQAVWQLDDNATSEALDELGSLSLVEFTTYSDERTILGEDNPTFPTFGLHDLAREFALSKRTDSETSLTEYLHARRYGVLLAETFRSLEWGLVFFDLERHNIESGFKTAASKIGTTAAYNELCLTYTRTTFDVLVLRLHPRQLLEWLDVRIEAARLVESQEEEAAGLADRGNILSLLGEYDEAIETFIEAIEFASKTKDQIGYAKSLSNLGACYDMKGEFDEGAKCYEEGLKIARSIGTQSLICSLLVNLGQPLAKTQKFVEAREVLDEAVLLARQLGDRRKEGIAISTLAEVYEGLGNPQKALDLWNEGLGIARTYGDKLAEGVRLGNIGNFHFRRGGIQKAREYWEPAVSILDSIESPQAETFRRLLVETAQYG